MDEPDALPTGVDFFETPRAQRSVENVEFVELHPITALAEKTSITFETSSGASFFGLSQSYVRVAIRLHQSDGAALPADVDVATLTMPALSVWKTVQLYINNVQIESINDHHLCAYVSTLLNATPTDCETSLRMAGFTKTDGNYSTANCPSFARLKRAFAKSETAHFMGRLSTSLFDCRQLLAPCRLGVVLHPIEAAKFIINLGAAPLKDIDYSIESCTLVLRRVTLVANLTRAILERAAVDCLKYPVSRVAVRPIYLTKGQQRLSNAVVARGVVPQRVVAAVLSQSAYHGTEQKLNMFGFTNHSVRRTGLTIDGRSIPASAHEDSVEDWGRAGDYDRFYHRLLAATDDGRPSLIDYDTYKTVHALFAYAPSGTRMQQPPHEGTTSIWMEFGSALAADSILLLCIEYQSTFVLDESAVGQFDAEI